MRLFGFQLCVKKFERMTQKKVLFAFAKLKAGLFASSENYFYMNPTF
jgi:hypothetical protein